MHGQLVVIARCVGGGEAGPFVKHAISVGSRRSALSREGCATVRPVLNVLALGASTMLMLTLSCTRLIEVHASLAATAKSQLQGRLAAPHV